MAKAKNEVGNKFGKLTVISQNGIKSTCRCECGNEHTAFTHNLRKLNTTQCTQCYRLSISKRKTTHGQSNYQNNKEQRQTKEYATWCAMKRRCFDEKDKRYMDYGGRGITVCEEWKNDFSKFFQDMGLAPDKKYQVDRINNELGYSKDNCKWVTQKENSNNKRNNIFLTIDDKTMTASQWSEFSGTKLATILSRKHKGYSDYDCVHKDIKKLSKVVISTPDGVFNGYRECAEKYKMSLSGINTRIQSKAFPDWIVL